MSTIYLSKNHPAYAELSALDGVRVADPATIGDKKPLRIGFVNLMPKPIDPIRDFGAIFARHAGHDIEIIDFTPIPENITTDSDTLAYRHEHMRPLSKLPDTPLDGIAVTGSAKENLPHKDLRYYPELQVAFKYIEENQIPTYASCMGSHLGLDFFHNVEKTWDMDSKVTGVFTLTNKEPTSPLMRGMDDHFTMAVSRYGRSDERSIVNNPNLQVLAGSEETGAAIVYDGLVTYVTGHPEYNAQSLPGEYFRDCDNPKIGREKAPLPVNVFKDNHPNKKAILPATWKRAAGTFMGNWIRDVAQKKIQKAREDIVVVSAMPPIAAYK